MNVWPVLVREARSTARQAGTYRLRVIALAAFLGVAGVLALRGAFELNAGGRAFAAFHLTLFIATWALVPFLTADCLSRERREGTLGLLFLTPLRALDIVLAKLAVHGLRGLTMWLAVIPILSIPLLAGGVSWQQAAAAGLQDLSALFLALAAGVLASAWSKTWVRSVTRAFLFAALFCLGMLLLQGILAFAAVARTPGVPPGYPAPPLFSQYWLWLGGSMILGDPEALITLWMPAARGIPMTIAATQVNAAALGAAISLFTSLLAVLVAALKTRRSWQEEPPSAFRVAVEREFTTPILGRNVLRRWLQHSLSRNPVGWLERRTWSGRMVTFGWVAVVIGVFGGILTGWDFWSRGLYRYGFDLIPRLVAWPLLVSMAASAAGSFRRERETGVLELLLVSPMPAKEIAWGRLRGLYGQFAPTVALLGGCWIFLMGFPGEKSSVGPVLSFACGAAAIPCIGLYFSLRTRTFLAALTAALGVGLLLPRVFVAVIGFSLAVLVGESGYDAWRAVQMLVQDMLLVLLALLAWNQLVDLLEHRRFEFDREIT